MKNVLITTATAALLLASHGAFAQPQNRGEGPAQAPQAPVLVLLPGSGMGPGNSGQAPAALVHRLTAPRRTWTIRGLARSPRSRSRTAR